MLTTSIEIQRIRVDGASAGRYIFWIITWNLPAGVKRRKHSIPEMISFFWLVQVNSPEFTCTRLHVHAYGCPADVHTE